MKRLLLIGLGICLLGCEQYPGSKTLPVAGYISGVPVIKVCMEDSHQYYMTLGQTSSGLAPILTDDGRPVHCDDRMEPGETHR